MNPSSEPDNAIALLEESAVVPNPQALKAKMEALPPCDAVTALMALRDAIARVQDEQ
ncbi:hypothetical protein [Thaumasiovibrio sp. DFM-14]|uniref:hypothetical protein n=1 Tax=Thaumasiovibrio sp. DFM-14 TaxID=3384792 RepID=UPI0039A167DD